MRKLYHAMAIVLVLQIVALTMIYLGGDISPTTPPEKVVQAYDHESVEYIVVAPIFRDGDATFMDLLMDELYDLRRPEVNVIYSSPSGQHTATPDAWFPSEVLASDVVCSVGELYAQSLEALVRSGCSKPVMVMPSASSIPLRSFRDLQSMTGSLACSSIGPFGWMVLPDDLAPIAARTRECEDAFDTMHDLAHCLSQAEHLRLTLSELESSSSLQKVLQDTKSLYFPVPGDTPDVEAFNELSQQVWASRITAHYDPLWDEVLLEPRSKTAAEKCARVLHLAGNLNSLPEVPYNASQRSLGYWKARELVLQSTESLSEQVNGVEQEEEGEILFIVLLHRPEHPALVEATLQSVIYDANIHQWLLVPDTRLDGDKGFDELMQRVEEMSNVHVLPRELWLSGLWGGPSLVWKEVISLSYGLMKLEPFRVAVLTSADSAPLKPALQALRNMPDKTRLNRHADTAKDFTQRFDHVLIECGESYVAFKDKSQTLPDYMPTMPPNFLKSSQWFALLRKDWMRLLRPEHLEQTLRFMSRMDQTVVPDEAFFANLLTMAGIRVEPKSDIVDIWEGPHPWPRRINDPVSFGRVMGRDFCEFVTQDSALFFRKTMTAQGIRAFSDATAECFGII